VPQPTAPQWFVFRVILALAAAGIGAVVPGFISVNVKPYVRAGGAIALFVVIYLLNPPSLVRPPTKNTDADAQPIAMPTQTVTPPSITVVPRPPEATNQITQIQATPAQDVPFYGVSVSYSYSGSKGPVRILVCASQGNGEPICNAVQNVETGVGRTANLPVHMAIPGMLGPIVLNRRYPVDFEACFIQIDPPTRPPPKFGCQSYRYNP
jgi:hypothetical protein